MVWGEVSSVTSVGDMDTSPNTAEMMMRETSVTDALDQDTSQGRGL